MSCFQKTYTPIAVTVDRRVKKKPRDESGDVGGVGSDENDGKSSPDVDEKFVGPGLGRFEGDEVAAEESPHDPKRRSDGEVPAALTAPRIQAERAEPLVGRDRHGGYVEGREDSDPELGTERLKERQKRDVGAVLGRGEEADTAEEVGDREIHHFGAAARDAEGRKGHLRSTGSQLAHDAVPRTDLATSLPEEVILRYVQTEAELQIFCHFLQHA